jgi:hypothetical protein
MITALNAELAAKKETTHGSFIAAEVNDFIGVANLKIEPDIAMHDQEKLSRSLEKTQGTPGERSCKISV